MSWEDCFLLWWNRILKGHITAILAPTDHFEQIIGIYTNQAVVLIDDDPLETVVIF